MESSSRNNVVPSGPSEPENPNSESHLSHTDPKFQGAIRSHKKDQSTSKLRNNESPGTNVAAARAYNLGPNSCECIFQIKVTSPNKNI